MDEGDQGTYDLYGSKALSMDQVRDCVSDALQANVFGQIEAI